MKWGEILSESTQPPTQPHTAASSSAKENKRYLGAPRNSSDGEVYTGLDLGREHVFLGGEPFEEDSLVFFLKRCAMRNIDTIRIRHVEEIQRKKNPIKFWA